MNGSGFSYPLLEPWVEVRPALSGDGRFLAFEACRTALQKNPPRVLERGADAPTDIVLADLSARTARVITRAPGGAVADGASVTPSIDAAGDRVVFASDATNLVPGSSRALREIFLYRRRTGRLERISPPGARVGFGSSMEPCISSDGRRVAFLTYGLEREDDERLRIPVVCDLQRGRTAVDPLPAQARGPCYGRPVFSTDGTSLAFASLAPALAPERNRDLVDIYLLKLGPATMRRLSVAWRQVARDGPSLTPAFANGVCAFSSSASNLVAGDGNGTFDIFVFDLRHGKTERISVSSDGCEANGASFEPSISCNGRWVAFTSEATNLTAGVARHVQNVFLRDRTNGVTRLVSHRPDGQAGNGASYNPCISADGQHVAFISLADDLEGTRGVRGQIYVWDRRLDRSRRAPLPSDVTP